MRLPLLRVAAATSSFALLAAGIVAQVAPAPVAGPTAALMPPPWLDAFDVAAGTVQSLHVRASATAPAAVEVDVVLAGRVHTLDLHPFDVRAASFQLWLRTPAGLVPAPAPDPGTFRGTLRGEPDSAVAATVHGASVTAYVRRADGTLWIVQPLAHAVAGAPATTHVVFRGADGTPAGGRCGVEVDAPPHVPPVPSGGNDAWYVCELALEADHPLFLLNGANVAATQTDVLGVVNAVDLIFRNDVQVHLVVTQLVVDGTPDPYTTNVAPTLLSQFQSHWNASYAAFARDLAHLFTGRPLAANSNGTIGYAFVGVVCDQTNGYGVSQTHWSANYAYRVGVTAHEIGHGFNATHCDAQAQCSVMCSIIGGCSGNTGVLSASEQAQIVQHRQGASCLALQQTVPQITSATPTQIATVDPPLVTLGGNGFLGTTQVTVGGVGVTAGLQVIGDTQLRFTPPIGLPLGFHPVSVTNGAGTSNSSVLWYVGANPCKIVVPAAVVGGTAIDWRMGGMPNDVGLLGVSFQGTTSPFLGSSLLDGFLLLWSGALDARGMATLALPVPPVILNGFTVYSQLLDVVPATNTLRSASATPGTAITW